MWFVMHASQSSYRLNRRTHCHQAKVIMMRNMMRMVMLVMIIMVGIMMAIDALFKGKVSRKTMAKTRTTSTIIAIATMLTGDPAKLLQQATRAEACRMLTPTP